MRWNMRRRWASRSSEARMPSFREPWKSCSPFAQALDLHLAIEMHGPYCPSTPLFMEYEKLFEADKTGHLGVVMDFSAFTSGAPATVLNPFPDEAIHKPLLHKIRRLFNTTDIPEEDLIKMIYDEGGDELDELVARRKLFTGLGPSGKFGTVYYRTHPDYEGFRRLLKYSKYMHGKFMYVDDDLNSEGTDFPGFVKIMKEENYQGFIASEYEGDQYQPGETDERQISKHIQMLDKLWAEN